MDRADEILTEAARLIREKGLAKGWIARDASGAKCRADDAEAASFCAIGAVDAATRSLGCELGARGSAFDRLRGAISAMYEAESGIADWSDDSDAETVASTMLGARVTA